MKKVVTKTSSKSPSSDLVFWQAQPPEARLAAVETLRQHAPRKQPMRNKGFKEFIKLLNSRNVAYLVVGGYALAAHGHPRNLARSLGLIADPTTDITADVAAPRVSISEATHGSQ